WLHDLLDGASDVAEGVRASAYNAIGVLALPQGDLDGSEKYHNLALDSYKTLGDDRGTSAALHNLGMVASDRGDLDLARERYQQALEMARNLGDRARVAASLMNIGCVAYDSQQYADARVPIEESLAIQRELRNRWYVGKALALLGEIAIHLEDYEDAKAYLGECLPIFIGLSDTDGATLALLHLGIAAAKTGNEPTAVQLFSVVDRVRVGVERGIHPAIQETSRIAKQELARHLGWEEYQRLESMGRTLDLRQAWLLAS
nr:tetratricopeptide repeat protein [Armatimonadota bacterium]